MPNLRLLRLTLWGSALVGGASAAVLLLPPSGGRKASP